MKKRLSLVCILGLVSLLACGKAEETVENTISIDKSGSITGIILESFDKDYYNEAELKNEIDSELSGYAGASLEEFIVENGVVRANIAYPSADAYAALNQVVLFQGTIEEALAEGYDFSGSFVQVKRGKKGETADSAAVTSSGDANVVIFEEATKVEVPSNITYISSELEILNKKQARAAGIEPDEHVEETEEPAADPETADEAEVPAETEPVQEKTAKLYYVIYK